MSQRCVAAVAAAGRLLRTGEGPIKIPAARGTAGAGQSSRVMKTLSGESAYPPKGPMRPKPARV